MRIFPTTFFFFFFSNPSLIESCNNETAAHSVASFQALYWLHKSLLQNPLHRDPSRMSLCALSSRCCLSLPSTPWTHSLQPEPRIHPPLYSEDNALWTQSPTKRALDLNRTMVIFHFLRHEKLLFFRYRTFGSVVPLKKKRKFHRGGWELVFHPCQSPVLIHLWI